MCPNSRKPLLCPNRSEAAKTSMMPSRGRLTKFLAARGLRTVSLSAANMCCYAQRASCNMCAQQHQRFRIRRIRSAQLRFACHLQGLRKRRDATRTAFLRHCTAQVKTAARERAGASRGSSMIFPVPGCAWFTGDASLSCLLSSSMF